MVFREGRGGLERLYSGLWFLVKCVSPHFVSFMCFRNDPNEQILLVGKGQQVKMQRRGPVFTPTVVLTSNMSKLSLCITGARENFCSVRPNPSRVVSVV